MAEYARCRQLAPGTPDEIGLTRAAHYQSECARWLAGEWAEHARRGNTLSGGGGGDDGGYDAALPPSFKLAWCKKADPATVQGGGKLTAVREAPAVRRCRLTSG